MHVIRSSIVQLILSFWIEEEIIPVIAPQNYPLFLWQDIRRFFAPKPGRGGGGSSSTDDEPKNKKKPASKAQVDSREMYIGSCSDIPIESVFDLSSSLTCSDCKLQIGGKTISQTEEEGHRWFRSLLNPEMLQRPLWSLGHIITWHASKLILI